MNGRILVVDDEAQIRKFLRIALGGVQLPPRRQTLKTVALPTGIC